MPVTEDFHQEPGEFSESPVYIDMGRSGEVNDTIECPLCLGEGRLKRTEILDRLGVTGAGWHDLLYGFRARVPGTFRSLQRNLAQRMAIARRLGIRTVWSRGHERWSRDFDAVTQLLALGF